MSKLIVEVSRVDELLDHPNADKMKIVKIRGWETCVRFDPETGRSQFEPGQKCIYIPYDVVLPLSLANGPNDTPSGRLDVAKYCAPVKDLAGDVTGYRVRAARLRGSKSFGIVMAIDPEWGDDPNWEVGTDVADYFKITKWEPPERCQDGDAERPNPRFHTYTDIDKYQNFPDAIADGTDVVFTEKIHGMNSRLGYIIEPNEQGDMSWVFAAGSHGVRRRQYVSDGSPSKSVFWAVFSDNIKELLKYIASDEFEWHVPKLGIIVFGEIYGLNVQDMSYGMKGKGFRAFDIAINEQYLDFNVKMELLSRFNVPVVPLLYRGPFSKEVLEQHTDGNTTICRPEEAGKFRGREGVVCTPIVEQFSNVLGGRCIIKSVSVNYLERKGGTDSR